MTKTPIKTTKKKLNNLVDEFLIAANTDSLPLTRYPNINQIQEYIRDSEKIDLEKSFDIKIIPHGEVYRAEIYQDK